MKSEATKRCEYNDVTNTSSFAARFACRSKLVPNTVLTWFYCRSSQLHKLNVTYIDQPCRIYSPVDDQWHNATCTAYDEATKHHTFQMSKRVFKTFSIDGYQILWEKDRAIQRNEAFR